jgi:uncharacterized RDD family membrane protein YckC
MFCPKCGKEADSSGKFCNQCGSELSTPKQNTSEKMVFCNRCGKETDARGTFCQWCGNDLRIPAQPVYSSPPVGSSYPLPPPPPPSPYAGFWVRLMAWFIDTIILGIIAFFIGVFLGVLYYASYNPYRYNYYYDYTSSPAFVVTFYVLFIPIVWLYFAAQESSEYQATIGKRAMRIKVTDIYGKPISFMRATGRWASKIISAIVLGLGFIIIGFTDRKQGLHDMIVDTLVLYSH